MSLNCDQLTASDLLSVPAAEIRYRGLVGDHLNSFNSFLRVGLPQIVTEIYELEKTIPNTRSSNEEDLAIAQIMIKATYSDVDVQPPQYDLRVSGKHDALFPSMARNKDMNLSAPVTMNINVRAEAIFKDTKRPNQVREETIRRFKFSLPIPVRCIKCNTHNKTEAALRLLNEDPKDQGAYFIFRGGEWIISMVESRLFNSPHIFRNRGHEKEVTRLEFLSKQGDAYENSSELIIKFLNTGHIHLKFSSGKYLKYVDLPFYMLFRLFGMNSDKEIMDSIVYGYSEGSHRDPVSDRIVSAVKIAMQVSDPIFTEEECRTTHQLDLIEIISEKSNELYNLKENGPTTQVDASTGKFIRDGLLKTLDKIVLPHIGISSESRHKKMRFLGLLIHKSFLVEMEIIPSTDRDSLKGKRILAAGRSYAKKFKTEFNLQVNQVIRKHLMNSFKTHSFSSAPIESAIKPHIKSSELEKALINAIISGSKETGRTKEASKISSENLQRKNQLNVLSALRVIRAATSKKATQDSRADEMRRVHPSYAGYICPIQSTDSGDSVGVVKQLAFSASVTDSGVSRQLIEVLLKDPDIRPQEKVLPSEIWLYKLTKVYVNGDWIGCVVHGPELARKYREMRRHYSYIPGKVVARPGELPIMDSDFKYSDRVPDIAPDVSVYWDSDNNECNFWADAGRLIRPLLVVRNNGELDPIGRRLIGTSYDPFTNTGFIQDLVLSKDDVRDLNSKKITIEALQQRGVIDYISPEELENCYVASSLEELKNNQNNPLRQFTHCEIPPVLLGLPALTCPYANHNQAPRITFQTNQGKQTCGWYSLDWPFRVDKHAFLQYYCEAPLVRTIANNYLYPNGSNEEVAILCYGGGNQEDSLINNQASSQRGLFKGDALNFSKVVLEKGERFTNPSKENTLEINKNANYSNLVKGIPKKGSILRRGDVIFGKSIELEKGQKNYQYRDTSVMHTSAEEAMVQDTIVDHNIDGEEFGKVKYSSVRTSDVGSKFCIPETYEVLTTTGWVALKDITFEHHIACLMDHERLEYHNPTEIVNFEYTGKIYSLNAQQIKIECTPEHKLYVKRRYQSQYESLRARDVYQTRVQWKKNALWVGKEIENYTLSDDEWPGGYSIPMDGFLKFLGLFISDGWVDRTAGIIYISCTKERKVKQLHDLCAELSLPITPHGQKWIINHKPLYHILDGYSVGALNKFLPEFVWDLCARQANLLLEWLIKGDGTCNASGAAAYCTASDRLADDISRLCLHAGWSGTIRLDKPKGSEYSIKGKSGTRNNNSYKVGIIKRLNTPTINHAGVKNQKSKTRQREEVAQFSGRMACVEVPGHVFYYRCSKLDPPAWTANSSRHGQKGVIGVSYYQSVMPFTANGIIPDHILSPFAIPSRMTIGQLIEGQEAKECAMSGTTVDATIFNDVDIAAVGKRLEARGYDRGGVERMYCGFSGEMIDKPVFLSPIYYQRLQKFGVDEVYSISTGPTSILTRQPLEGKSNNGGLRIGEMEKDVIISHGAGHMLMEKFRDDSDGFDIYVCRRCGKTPIVNEKKNIIICKVCNYSGLDPDVVKVRSTWASKLFIQELESAGVSVTFTLDPYIQEVQL